MASLGKWSILPVLTAGLLGQTFVVDPSGGGSFLDIASAVVAVPSGATLLVRPGSYGAFTVSQKGLTILGDPGVSVASGCVVSSTSPSQAVELRNLSFSSGGGSTGHLSCTGCQGLVRLASLSVPPVPSCSGSPCVRAPALAVVGCAQVLATSCVVQGNVFVDTSEVVLDTCTVTGEFAVTQNLGGTVIQRSASRAGLHVASGSVQSTSSIQGGFVLVQGFGTAFAGADGVILGSTASLRLLRGTVADGGSAFGTTVPSAVSGSATSVLRLDPSVVLLTAGSVPVRTTPVTSDVMPAVQVGDAVLGGVIQASATTSAPHPVVLVVGLQGPVLQVPGVSDPFWIDPTWHYFASFGVLGSGQTLLAGLQVPFDPVLSGVRVAWSAVAIEPSTGALEASNPGVSSIH